MAVSVVAVAVITAECRCLVVASTCYFAHVHAIVHLEIGILVLSCTENAACYTAGTRHVGFVHAVQNLTFEVCSCLQSAYDSSSTIAAGNRATLVDDEVLDDGIAANIGKESPTVFCGVDNHVLDAMELSVELAVELKGCACANRQMRDVCQVDVGSKHSLRHELGIVAFCVTIDARVNEPGIPFKVTCICNLINAVNLFCWLEMFVAVTRANAVRVLMVEFHCSVGTYVVVHCAGSRRAVAIQLAVGVNLSAFNHKGHRLACTCNLIEGDGALVAIQQITELAGFDDVGGADKALSSICHTAELVAVRDGGIAVGELHEVLVVSIQLGKRACVVAVRE